MKRSTVPVALVLCIALGAAWGLLGIRTAASQSPDAWRQLSLPAFVQEITRLTSAAEPLPDALWSEIRSQSAQRLVQAVAPGASADYGDLVSLYLWARPVLTAEQVSSVLAGLRSPANQLAAWTFEQMRGIQDRMLQAGMPLDAVYDVTCSWLGERDVRTLENVDQLGWLFSQLEAVDRHEIGPQEFSVRWTGLVRAPADGTYTFSICPLDLNYAHGGTLRAQTMAIWVGAQQMLDSTANGWTYEATPVALSGTAPTPLRVELTYACTSAGVIDDRPAVAMLSWEGPGLAKQLVPSAALTTPDGSQQGLQGEYVLQAQGAETRVTRVDPQVNFIWFHQCFVASARDELRRRLAAQFYAVARSASTLAAWEQNAQANPERWQAHWAFLEALDVARQKEWTGVLLAHPALIIDCPNWAIANLYSRCRIGAPDESVQVVGLWAQAHADEGPVLDVDYYAANRGVYRELARKLGSQYAPHLQALEQEYLVLADGRCALPVAYICAYGYWDQGRIGEWVTQLDARLADDQLTGDRRVNWLLARAQAEEIRHSPAYQHWFTADRFLAGRGWIEEATLAAGSEAARRRAFQELAARLAAHEQLGAARALLDQAGQRCTSAESVAALAAWRTTLDALAGQFQVRHEQQEAAARAAYLMQLRQRHQRALERGDQAARARYEERLTAAGALPE